MAATAAESVYVVLPPPTVSVEEVSFWTRDLANLPDDETVEYQSQIIDRQTQFGSSIIFVCRISGIKAAAG